MKEGLRQSRRNSSANRARLCERLRVPKDARAPKEKSDAKKSSVGNAANNGDLSTPVKLFHNRQDEEQVPASVVWIHSDVYEMNFLKDGVAHVCTVISKGDDLLVTIEIREPTKEPMTKGDKPETIVINGKIHRFKLNKKDGRMSEIVWMLYGETDKGLRFTNSVKSGPSTKRMLEPFKEVLAKLPTEICELLEKILR